MPRPFSFAAAFFPGVSSEATSNSTSAAPSPGTLEDDSHRVPCAPTLSIKFPPLPNLPVPNIQLPLKREHPPVRACQCAVVMGTGACDCGTPEELIVLAHGLQGEVDDFSYLLDTLAATAPAQAGRVLVHASSVNTDRTHDGVVSGGERLAYDIRAVIANHPSLERVSLMGFSLGGLYVRYAAAALFNPEDGTIAGLTPNRFFAVAAPNLGVRSFGVYRFLPPAVRSKAHFFIGDTGRELFLEDANNLLVRMSLDDDDNAPRPLKFLSSLRAFDQRYLYANTKGDFMVNYGTSALDHSVAELSMSTAYMPEHAEIDRCHDERGCKVCFTMQYESAELAEEEAPRIGEEERLMAKRLRSVGWTVVAVEFPVSIPIAHNRIVAMSRGPIHTFMNSVRSHHHSPSVRVISDNFQAGRRVVHHLVDTLMDSFGDDDDDKHEPTFRKIDVPPLGRRSLSLRNL